MDLRESLHEQYKMSDSDLENSMQYFEPEMISTKCYFLKQGKIADKLGFLKAGLLRSYFYDDHGDEITNHFFLPGNVVISMDSFNNRKPAPESIIAVEDSEMLVISYERMADLFESVPIWRQIAKDVSEIKFNNLMNRSIMLQTLTAAERYNMLIENHPEIIQKVALRHIASYLGIDIATLSRIRKRQ